MNVKHLSWTNCAPVYRLGQHYAKNQQNKILIFYKQCMSKFFALSKCQSPIYRMGQHYAKNQRNKKMTSNIFGQFTCWNPWVSIFCIFGGTKAAQKVGDKKFVMHCNRFYRNNLSIKNDWKKGWEFTSCFIDSGVWKLNSPWVGELASVVFWSLVSS